MLYESTKGLLRDMLYSLQQPAAIRWDEQIELAGECSYEIHQMSRPLYKGYVTDPVRRAPVLVTVSDRAARAVPHVRLMVRAIRRKDQPAAVKSGLSALNEM